MDDVDPATSPALVGGVPPRRRRGRRPHSDAESAQVRERILQAFAQVFAAHGYHGLTVARVLDRAGIARGTYYRYFRDIDEPMAILLQRITQSLAELIVPPILTGATIEAKVTGAIDGYLEWGRRHRALLPSFYAGLHDPASPISASRRRWGPVLVDFIVRQHAEVGVPEPDRGRIDVLISTLEFASYRHYISDAGNDATIDLRDDEQRLAITRETMLRSAVALLTPPADWPQAAAALHLV